MRDAVFRAPENHGTPAVPATTLANPLIRKVIVYSLPAHEAGSEEAAKAFHLFLMVAGTSTTTRRDLWQNYVCTIVCACFPSMRTGILRYAAIEEVVLSQTTMDALKGWYDLYSACVEGEDPAFVEAAKGQLMETVIDMRLPPGLPALDVDLADSLDLPAIYGHVSMVLFVAGKTISDANRASITQKRPGAIERKYFGGKVVGPLQGSLRLSNEAHGQIHSAFVSMAHVRKEVFTKVATFNNIADVDPAIEVVATTTRLMRYQGMQQAVLIDQFLSAHEEAFAIPILMPSIQAYAASMRDLMAAPVEQRPYYKIIHGDSTRAFNRNDISNLLVVAVMEARETNPTMMQYAIPANQQLIMDKYMQSLEALEENE